MMPSITASHEFDSRLRVLVISGEVTEAEILEWLPHIGQPGSSLLTLWDFTSGALGFRPDESGGLSCLHPPPDIRRVKTSRTALVCPNELDHGLFRLLRVFTPQLKFPEEVRLFRNMRAARRWLGACQLCVQQVPIEEVLAKPCVRSCSRLRPPS